MVSVQQDMVESVIDGLNTTGKNVYFPVNGNLATAWL